MQLQLLVASAVAAAALRDCAAGSLTPKSPLPTDLRAPGTNDPPRIRAASARTEPARGDATSRTTDHVGQGALAAGPAAAPGGRCRAAGTAPQGPARGRARSRPTCGPAPGTKDPRRIRVEWVL